MHSSLYYFFFHNVKKFWTKIAHTSPNSMCGRKSVTSYLQHTVTGRTHPPSSSKRKARDHQHCIARRHPAAVAGEEGRGDIRDGGDGSGASVARGEWRETLHSFVNRAAVSTHAMSWICHGAFAWSKMHAEEHVLLQTQFEIRKFITTSSKIFNWTHRSCRPWVELAKEP